MYAQRESDAHKDHHPRNSPFNNHSTRLGNSPLISMSTFIMGWEKYM